PALALQAEEAGLLLGDVGGQGAGRVDVADGDIALLPQGVVGQPVAGQVPADVAVGPVGDGVQLPAVVLALQELDVGAGAALAAAQAGDPGAHAQLGQGALHRLDLAPAVVALLAFDVVFPDAAHARVHPGHADLRAVDLEVEREAVGGFVDEAVGLGEQLAGVDH